MTDEKDIERLFKTHYGPMHRLALAILHDDAQANDVVQDIFTSLLDGANGVMVSRGYLLRAVRNRCLNQIRDREIHERIAHRYFLNNDEYDTEDWPDEETLERIRNMIDSEISSQSRRVMNMRFSEGMPFAQIAAAMGISETAVYRHMSNALSLIRKRLRD